MLFLCKVVVVLFIIWEIMGIVEYLRRHANNTETIADELRHIRKIIQKKFDSDNK